MLLICCIGLLSGCATSKPQCTNIILYDYGDDGYCLKAIHWFQADYYDHPFFEFDGLVVATKYLGQGVRSQMNLCKDPVILDGWYSVHIPDGQASWILVGQGWGTTVDIKPNFIRSKELKRITEVLR
jgi:hypothetical protein